MQVSYFETGRYYAPSDLPRQWPMPAGAYDREAGLRAFRGMVERSRYVEELGFDWVSVSEHHYSPRILTPPRPTSPRMCTTSRSRCWRNRAAEQLRHRVGSGQQPRVGRMQISRSGRVPLVPD
jgi:hypothetical protein